MDCEEVKKIIPRYFQHSATEQEINKVEEHLCVCHECRTTLGELMDKLSSDEESEPQAQEIETPVQEEETVSATPTGPGFSLQPQETQQPENSAIKSNQEPAPSSEESFEIKEEQAEEPEAAYQELEVSPFREIYDAQKEQESGPKEPAGTSEETSDTSLSGKQEMPAKEQMDDELEPLPEEESEIGGKMEYFSGKGLDDSKENLDEDESAKFPEETQEPPAAVNTEIFSEEKKVLDKKPQQPDEVVTSGKEEAAAEAGLKKKSEWTIEGDEARSPLNEKSSYPLDSHPLESSKISILEYACLAVGVLVFFIIIYLRIAG